MRAATGFLAILVTALLLSPVLAQGQGQGQGQGHQGGPANVRADRATHAAAERDAGRAHEQEFNNLSETARARGLARAEEAKLFGRLDFANGNATGRFVSFGLDAAAGTVRDYTVRSGNNSTLFLSSVTATGWTANGAPRVTGSILRMDGGNVSLAAHNNPTAILVYRGANATVTFTAASNATVTPDNNRTVTVAVGNVHGHVVLHGEGTLAASGATVTLTLGSHGAALFMAHPGDAPLATANLHAVRDAIAADKLGGVLSVVNADGRPLTDATYLGVAMRASDVAPGRLNVTVSSPEPAAKSVVINVDGNVLNLTTPGVNLTVTLDGQRLNAAPNATAAAQGLAIGTYHVTNATGGGAQVVVSVPGFSEHVIGLSTQAAGTGTTPTVTSPVATSPATTSPATTSPAATSPATTSPAGTTPAGTTPTPDADTPAPAVVLVLLVLAALALVVRRREG